MDERDEESGEGEDDSRLHVHLSREFPDNSLLSAVIYRLAAFLVASCRTRSGTHSTDDVTARVDEFLINNYFLPNR